MPTPQALANLFRKGEYVNDVNDVNDVDGSVWREAFLLLANNVESAQFDKHKVHTLWTVNGGHLRRKIQDDALILRVLKMSLPGYQGDGMWLYRGECQFLYAKNLIGFCWSPKIEVAQMFARGLNAIESGGVLLKAYSPTKAILAEPNDHSAKQMAEFEYTCDPWELQSIAVIQTFPKF